MFSKRTPENPPETVAERAIRLNAELDQATRHYRNVGRVNYYFSMFLVAVSIVVSAGIAIAGILFDAPPKLLGVIALFPAIATGFNTIFQPQSRSSWHYKKKDRLNALRRRLLYELPVPPTADNIAAISNEWERIDSEMNVLWEKSFSIDWTAVAAVRFAKQSDTAEESNGQPSPRK